MPKSRRDKKISLTKTKPKTKANKDRIIQNIRDCLEVFKTVFLFTIENYRNSTFKEVRSTWGGSRFFMGKNKLMQIALGRTEEEESKKNIHLLAERINGNCGLLFTNTKKENVIKYFQEFQHENFARSGFIATEDFSLDEGPLDPEKVPFSKEPLMRKLGLKTKLDDGQVILLQDTVVCKKGEQLTPEQCKILEIFDVKQATFRIHLLCYWEDDQYVNIQYQDAIQQQTAIGSKNPKKKKQALSSSSLSSASANDDDDEDGPVIMGDDEDFDEDEDDMGDDE